MGEGPGGRRTISRMRRIHSFVLISALLAAPCSADILRFSGQDALPNCAYQCDALYAGQFACKTANDPSACFCKQDAVNPQVCDQACTKDSDRAAVAKFLEGVCGSTKGTKTSIENVAEPSPTSSPSKKETKTSKAIEFWSKNWQWFLIGFICIALPLIVWALAVPVRRYYKKKRRNTTPIVWSNIGREDYARVPQRGTKTTPVNRSQNTSRGSSSTTHMLSVSSMLRSSSTGSASDTEAAKSFLTSSDYDGGAYAAGPAMEDFRGGRSMRHTVDGYQQGHSQDMLSVPDRSNRFTHPQQSPVPTRQLFQPVHGVAPILEQQQLAPRPQTTIISQNPAPAPQSRRKSEGQQGHRGPPPPIRMGHQSQQIQQVFQQQPQQQWHQEVQNYQPHQQQQSYDSGVRTSTFPISSSSRWEQEPNHNSQQMEQRMPMIHSSQQFDNVAENTYVDPSQIGRAA